MIPLATPNLSGKEAEYTAQAERSGWLDEGPFVERFEELVAGAAGRDWAVAVATGTAALHVAAYVLGFRGRPMLVQRDAYPAAWNIFHQLGCDVKSVPGGANHDIADYVFDAGRWPILCDRAPAIGQAPTDATLECYSFAINKTVTTGRGGAVVGDDKRLRERIVEVIHQGYGRPGVFNYRMGNDRAARGCAQMERLGEFLEAKRRIWQRYKGFGFDMIERGPSRWMATANISRSIDRTLKAEGIGHRIEPSGGISLPCSTHLTEADQDTVIKVCDGYLRS